MSGLGDSKEAARSRKQLGQFRAAKTLFDGTPASALDRDTTKHVAAAEQFQVSQMERQIAGLTFSKVLSTLESFLWSTHPKLLNFENVYQAWRPTPESSQMPASSPMSYQATNSQKDSSM